MNLSNLHFQQSNQNFEFFFEKERKEKSSLGTLGQWSLLGMKEGLLSFLNLEDEDDASKLHFPSSMRSYKLQHTYKHNVK
jgi:hypothetical protein